METIVSILDQIVSSLLNNLEMVTKSCQFLKPNMLRSDRCHVLSHNFHPSSKLHVRKQNQYWVVMSCEERYIPNSNFDLNNMDIHPKSSKIYSHVSRDSTSSRIHPSSFLNDHCSKWYQKESCGCHTLR